VGDGKTVRIDNEFLKDFKKMDINTASMEELMAIPHIKEIFARRIIEYRDKNNGFKSIEELGKVQGVGRKRLLTLMDFVEVEKITSAPRKHEVIRENIPKKSEIISEFDEFGRVNINTA